MKRTIIGLLTIFLAAVFFAEEAHAKVKQVDALKAANHWIALIINKKGSWGGSGTAQIAEIMELKHEGKKIGYFCKVSPYGFIVVSLRKELAPIKAYSSESDLDPDSDEGLAGLIREKMGRMISRIEKRLGPIDRIPPQALEKVLEVNYSGAWDELIGQQGEKTAAAFQAGIDGVNYQEGDILLSSSWHQGDPYNRQTPSVPGQCAHAVVGCVATAGAQIMRYWNWPPYGVGIPYDDPYDWPNMLDVVTAASPQASIDAVAELSAEVGQAVGMNYTCTLSGSLTADMIGVYSSHYRYSTGFKAERISYTPATWFAMLKAEFNANRPVQYRISGHSIVADGWQEIGAGPTRQYHMNYGWNLTGTCQTGCNTWYTVDGLYQIPGSGGTPDDEFVLTYVFPNVALSSSIYGTYARIASFPYRYFFMDTSGSSATFQSGQYLQFLPNISVTNTSTTGGLLRFEGTNSLNTRLFTRGDPSVGVKISDGTIKISGDGSFRMH